MDSDYSFLNAGGNVGSLLRILQSKIAILNSPEICTPTLKTSLGICLNSGFPIAICWGKDFTFFYNDQYSLILGEKHPKALGSPTEIVYAEIWDTLEPQLTSVISSGITIKLPDAPFLLYRNSYLEECYFDYTLSPIYNAEGKIEGIFNVVIETTNKVIGQRRSQLMNKLIKIENTAQTLEKCINNCKMVLNEEQQEIPFYLIYLKRKDKIYALAASGGIDQPIDHHKWPVEDLLKSGNTVFLDSIADYLAEPIITFYPEPCCEAAIIPLKNQNAPISGYMIVGLSPRKKNDTDYKQFIENVGSVIGNCLSSAFSFDEFLSLEIEKENLLRIVSHELKAPITSIKGYAQLVMRVSEKKWDDDSFKLLIKMTSQINKLNLIITDMLDGTNFNSGRIHVTVTEFGFDNLVKKIVNEIYTSNSKHNIQIELGCINLYNGDKTRIGQVISNLLSNAIKYSPNGGNILIRTSEDNEKISFSISDQGIGIRKAEQQKIFERFYRSIEITRYPYPGMGLGLFISNEIIKLMGGKLWCESEEGKGTIFYFTLPLDYKSTN
ncbi:PAS domain-containing sensor histidine kinase [Pedobacter cryoconitis]|uniref:sensor histidine kinase n=1 Tax=Pedobacter cryoconitis TaxID=188932 RepID=UPI00161585AF|nr:PAS domain-containing sensor histidine kinase [Pedobacter cryoconitis]MBB5645799.1 signal transduction histidine kinase [Pedobacter cryoconitis]